MIKAIKCIIIIVFINSFLLPDDPSQTAALEIFLIVVNDSGTTTTYYTVGSSAIYDEATIIPTTEFWSGNFSVTGDYNDDKIGWQIMGISGGALENQWDTLGIGKYKFYTSTAGGPNFYLNLCDCRYFNGQVGDTYYPTKDLMLVYDGSDSTFSYMPLISQNDTILITNGETLTIWNALNATGPPTSDCFLNSFTPSNLSLSYVNNKAKLTWSIEHPDTVGAYRIYRTVWENGQYNNQTTLWSVVTVNSWIDDDFTRFKFGNYTIDYEVAYLSLPPNESAKSNKVTMTPGNWNGPVGKTMTDDFELNIHPNPFNSSVVIPLKKNTSSIIIYNLLGKTIKEYSSRDLSSKSQITWNGLDKYSQKVPSGTYFIMMVTDTRIDTRKVVFAK